MEQVIQTEMLATLMHQQQHAARQLLDVLTEETTELSRATPEGLALIIERKLQHINHLETTSECVSRHLGQLGIPQNKNQIKMALKSVNDHGELHAQWETIENLILECRTRNDANGKLIQKSQLYCTHLLQTLVKLGRDTTSSIYSANGKANESSFGSRTLGSA